MDKNYHQGLKFLLLIIIFASLDAKPTIGVRSKYQVECEMCSSCENPCNTPSPPPPPPTAANYPPPPPSSGGNYYYPPPPQTPNAYYAPPGGATYYNPPPPYFAGIAPPPPDPIMPYFPYFYRTPPPSSSSSLLPKMGEESLSGNIAQVIPMVTASPSYDVKSPNFKRTNSKC